MLTTDPTSSRVATIELDGQTHELPVVEGTEKERGIDVSSLRAKTGLITVDDGYGNTGSCLSDITFINGEKGILRYRGIPIEQLAANSTFVETAYLLIHGELPTEAELAAFSASLTHQELIHENLKYHFEGFPPTAHPMAILSSMINAMSCYHPHLFELEDDHQFDSAASRLISKVRTIAAFSYKKSRGQPFVYPKPDLGYAANLVHMMFSIPYKDYDPPEEVVKAINLILMLHADHEQNCSTSTVRMVGSSRANLFASVAAGVCALWGPLHGGANMAVINMLEEMVRTGMDLDEFVANVKDKRNRIRLMGFGHRVYKSHDPRARILKQSADEVLEKLGIHDPALEVAKKLEEVALSDDYFLERRLYPNVDFYSGLIMRAIGFPLDMFTVMFSIGRMPGWIAHWREVNQDTKARIYRPRQIYMGYTERDYVPIGERE